MPNHVTNKISFSSEHAETVFSTCCPDGKFDFGTLIPEPPQLYRGDISSVDEEDFPCNWLAWHRKNWGTKWNAYNSICYIEGRDAFIEFDTASSVPYPVIAAFANRFGIDFEHRYCDEAPNFWGIELWERFNDEKNWSIRVENRKSLAEDRAALYRELIGRDLEGEKCDRPKNST